MLRRLAIAVALVLGIGPLPSAAQSAAPENYLTRSGGQTFRTPFGDTKPRIEPTVNGEWLLKGPVGQVYLIIPDGAGGFQFWGTNGVGGRYDGAGLVGNRGVRVCARAACSVWLTAADGQPYYLGYGYGKNAGKFYGAFPLFPASGPDEEWDRWYDGAVKLHGRLKDPAFAAALLGFQADTLEGVDAWITQPFAQPRGVPQIAAVPTAPAPAPVRVAASPPPADVYVRRSNAPQKKKRGLLSRVMGVLVGDDFLPAGTIPYTPAPNPLFSPSPVYNSPAPSLPGMGGSYSVAAPQATPAQSAQQAELQAYQTRQQLYGQGGGSADSQRSGGRPAYSGGAASSGEGSAGGAAGGTSGSGSAASAGTGNPGSGSSGGIIVRDTSAEKAAWERAEAERLRSNAEAARAEALRKAEDQRRWEEEKKRGDEINRVSEEMRRAAEQRKKGGNTAPAKPAKAKPI